MGSGFIRELVGGNTHKFRGRPGVEDRKVLYIRREKGLEQLAFFVIFFYNSQGGAELGRKSVGIDREKIEEGDIICKIIQVGQFDG